jgi:hypothetical protein
LRRLYKKWPYFTNGHALSVADVLARFAADPKRTFHDNAPNDAALTRLSSKEQADLLAFLALL